MFTNQTNTMNQFAGLDVKIQVSDNIAKRVKMPQSYAELSAQVVTLAQAKGLDTTAPLSIRYTDAENEFVIIEDDVDLEMAYTIAFNFLEKRIKLFVDTDKSSVNASQVPSTAVSEQNVEMQM